MQRNNRCWIAHRDTCADSWILSNGDVWKTCSVVTSWWLRYRLLLLTFCLLLFSWRTSQLTCGILWSWLMCEWTCKSRFPAVTLWDACISAAKSLQVLPLSNLVSSTISLRRKILQTCVDGLCETLSFKLVTFPRRLKRTRSNNRHWTGARFCSPEQPSQRVCRTCPTWIPWLTYLGNSPWKTPGTLWQGRECSKTTSWKTPSGEFPKTKKKMWLFCGICNENWRNFGTIWDRNRDVLFETNDERDGLCVNNSKANEHFPCLFVKCWQLHKPLGFSHSN